MMHLLAEQTSVNAGNWILLLLDASLKGSVILVAAVLLDSALRSTSASNRYRMWCCALCSLAAIPLLAGVLPKWQVPLLPNPDLVSVSQPRNSAVMEIEPPTQSAIPEAFIETAPVETNFQPLDTGDLQALAHLLTQDSDAISSVADEPLVIITPPKMATTPDEKTNAGFVSFGLPNWHWSVWVIAFWVMGALGLVMYLLAGISRIAAITRSAIPLDDEDSIETLGKLSRQAGVLRPVRLLHCRQIRTPMTWGHMHPVILLPTSCIGWSKTRRRIVLLHELVHIRRGDWLMQIASQLICAAYWCNPLVWIASRRLCIERERACDDLVLDFGTRPTEYASHLLDIARNIASGGSLTMASLGMAHRSQLEGRLLSILDPRMKRHGFSRIATLTAIVGMGAGVMPLAAIQPWAEAAIPEAVTVQDDDDRGDRHVIQNNGEVKIKSDGKYNFNWTEDDDVVYRVRVKGNVVLTNDGIKSISEDGYVRITEEDDDDERRVVIKTNADGKLSYAFRINGENRKSSEKARRWADRVVKKTVKQIKQFEKAMAELDENMEQLDLDMKEMQENLHQQLSELEIPDIVLPDLEGLHEKLSELHELKIQDLDDLDINVITDIHLKYLDKLQTKIRTHTRSLHEKAGEHQQMGEQIRNQVRKQMDSLHEQLSELHDLDFDFGDFDFGDLKFEFDHGKFDFDHETFEKKLESALEKHGNTFEQWTQGNRHDFPDIQKHLGPHLKQLQERLEGLEFELPDMAELHEQLKDLHSEMPDMAELHKLLEPMMKNIHKNMPRLEGLSERIEKHLKPHMDKLHERLEVLKEYLDEVREEISDEVRQIIEEEIKEADLDLSRSERRSMSGLIDELVEACTNHLGMNIEDGLVEFNSSKRRIQRKLTGVVSEADIDLDVDASEILEAAIEQIADRLSDLEIEIDSDLADKIENFDVEFDFDFSDLKFDFNFGDDEDDDDEDDDIALNSIVA